MAFVHEPRIVLPKQPATANLALRCLDLDLERLFRVGIQDQNIDPLRVAKRQRAVEASQGEFSKNEELSSQRHIVGGSARLPKPLFVGSPTLSTQHVADIHMCITISARVPSWTPDACWLKLFGRRGARPALRRRLWPEPLESVNPRSIDLKVLVRT